MSAGTIVIAGGILAGVILLCIVAVLCYCRLQYYCCKKNESEGDKGSVAGPDPLAHFPCNACAALANHGAAITPVSLDLLDSGPRLDPCPACSPYSGADACNGGERLGFHTYYETPPPPRALAASLPSALNLLFPPPPRPYSTDV